MSRPSRPWTEKERAFLSKECRKPDADIRAIAKRMGRSHMALYKMMQEMGIRRMRKKRVWTTDKREMLADLWPSDLTVEEIAQRIGLTPGAVTRQASDQGLRRRPTEKPGGLRYETPRQIGQWPDLPPDAFKDVRVKADPRTTLRRERDMTLGGIGSAL